MRSVLVLYGGVQPQGQDFEDTWEWDGQNWMRKDGEGPGPREAAGIAYDAERERTVLYGGAQLGNMMGDTWEWDGREWRQAASQGPQARFPAGFVYDAGRHVVMLFGGHALDARGFTTYGDTWTWDGATWRLSTSPGPSPRDGARAAFDPLSTHTLLFGGAQIDPTVTVLNDTWLWDGSQWLQIEVEGPPPRVHPAMAFDVSRERFVMTGGANTLRTILGDTWEWDGQTWTCEAGCE
jgi:hypothetical protein